MSEPVHEATADTFESVVGSADTVVVDFWGPNCAPCTVVARAMSELAAESAGPTRFAKLNVDEARDLAERLGIRGVPAVIVFRNGEPAKRLFGGKNKRQIQQAIDDAGSS